MWGYLRGLHLGLARVAGGGGVLAHHVVGKPEEVVVEQVQVDLHPAGPQSESGARPPGPPGNGRLPRKIVAWI